MRYRPVQPVAFWLGVVLLAAGAVEGGTLVVPLGAGSPLYLGPLLGIAGVFALVLSYALGLRLPGVPKAERPGLPRFQPHRRKL